MRSRTGATLAVVGATAAAVLLVGCGSDSGSGSGSASSSAPSVSASPSPQCGDVVITPDSASREVCLSVGSTLRIQLGSGDQAPTETGGALATVSPGVYRGARAGSAELSGFRHVCPSATPGGMSCMAIAGWKVTVDVR